MTTRVVIRLREYHDSVRLMQVSERVRKDTGVKEAILMMATGNNKKILEASGVLTDEVSAAKPDDLVVAVVAADDAQADAAIAAAIEQLSQRTAGAETAYAPRTLEAALAVSPQANIALISVPGDYAAAEARRALNQGLHVMLFSDNVPLQDELSLKQLADSNGLLLMGPDCGTAIINGVGLGFANRVRRGSVGVVGASGTGIQEITTLLDRMAIGISQAIGTGGRDLKEEIGGITMLRAIDMLAADPATDIIVLTSKPPAAKVAETILQKAAATGKPVVVNFLGAASLTGGQSDKSGNLIFASSLEAAALAAAERLHETASLSLLPPAQIQRLAEDISGKLQPSQRYVRGLYAGGTLCYEALLSLHEELGQVFSNIALDADNRLQDLWTSRAHTLVDMGDDEYTRGRAHPMIDPTLRMQRILQEAADPEVALLLMDVVLGFGAHENPAEILVETVQQARQLAEKEGRYLPVVVTVCGTESDSQSLSEQTQILRDAGITVAASNAEAARLAAALSKAMLSKTIGERHGN